MVRKDNKQLCKVCGKWIGLYGWPSHVKKENRIHGDDVYKGKKIYPIVKRTPVIQDYIK